MTFGKFGYIIMSFAAHLQKSLRSLIKFLGDEYMKYFIKIKDECGKEISIEVSAEIFEVYEDERKYKERQRNEIRRHYDKRQLEDYIIANEINKYSLQLPEEVYLNREKVKEALSLCTPTQRRRFCLNKIYGYSCEEIAKIEGCAKNAVVKSIAAAMKKIRQKI